MHVINVALQVIGSVETQCTMGAGKTLSLAMNCFLVHNKGGLSLKERRALETQKLPVRAVGLCTVHVQVPHNFRGPTWRYEIAISIKETNIVWASDPWTAGRFPDLNTSKRGLKPLLLRDEFVLADSGYPDSRCYHLLPKTDPTYHAMANIR